MTGQLSLEVVPLLRKQVTNEQRNQNSYRLFVAWLTQQGLLKLAARYQAQANEELEHSERVLKFLVTSDVPLDSIGGVDMTVMQNDGLFTQSVTLAEWLRGVVELENKTMVELQAIMTAAKSSDDDLTQTFMQNMLEEQRTEVHEAGRVYRLVENLNEPYLLELMI